MLNLYQESGAQQAVFETITAHKERGVLFAYIAAPPMNLMGPELVRDLITLIQQTDADDSTHVLVFRSADPDYFISHVDPTQITNSGPLACNPSGEPALAMLFRILGASRLVTIAQIEGHVRGVGSEFVLACDMRFAAREFATFGQPEARFGLVPGASAVRHLTRLMGRGRALEVLISADNYDARAAEHYGWVNRALPAVALESFVNSLAHRIAGFPASGIAAIKKCVSASAFAPAEGSDRDSTHFLDCVRNSETPHQISATVKPEFQARAVEMDRMLRILDTEV